MGMGSFILGVIVGVIIAFVLILAYIVTTFGWDFLPILINLLDGNVIYGDIMSLGHYFGYI